MSESLTVAAQPACIALPRSRVHEDMYEMIAAKFETPDLRMICTFDHLTAGYPSRILVGYQILEEKFLHHLEHTVSIVLDCIVPSRERPAGSNLNLGFLPDADTELLVDPNIFYHYAAVKPLDIPKLLEKAEPILCQHIRQRTKASRGYTRRITAQSMGRLATLLYLYQTANKPSYFLQVREHINAYLGLPGSIVKRKYDSKLMPLMADLFMVMLEKGIKFYDLPPAIADDKIFRIVSEEGRDEGYVWYDRERNSFCDASSTSYRIETLIEMVRQGRVLPVAALSLLALTVMPQIPHFGNQYGIVDNLCERFGIPSKGLNVVEDNRNSFPTGNISFRGRRIENTLLDFIHFSNDEYRSLVLQAARTGTPRHAIQFGDVRLGS